MVSVMRITNQKWIVVTYSIPCTSRHQLASPWQEAQELSRSFEPILPCRQTVWSFELEPTLKSHYSLIVV